ncbi:MULTISPECIES: DUF7500 family protein [Haloarcula]|uniref:DIX domain-containing protein n=2 Tax=Haloarcula TaxID=2237 RepID=M0LLF1_HALJT|nr:MULTISPECIES: hypothetical protein [Haloarcula]EMA25119.1 hypothetical protein C442_03492 [Haloarcula amylolytica JCM 13557]EMA34407.1 hypothetical protein C444_02691 [Haloarcula japonica DSM 6131]
MARRSDEPNPEEGKVLSPEELDIADDEHVTEIDEGRYVVSSDVRTDDSYGNQVSSDSASESPPSPAPDPEPSTPEFSDANVHEWLAEQMADSNARYGFDVTAKFDGDVDQQQLASNDIVTVFESFMLWYGRQMDGSTPVEEVLGILLSESNVPVRYPPAVIKQLVRSTQLTPDDSIADLLEAVEAADGAEL